MVRGTIAERRPRTSGQTADVLLCLNTIRIAVLQLSGHEHHALLEAAAFLEASGRQHRDGSRF